MALAMAPLTARDSTIMMRLWITSPAFPPRPEASDQLDGAGRAESVALAQRQAKSQEKTERIGRIMP